MTPPKPSSQPSHPPLAVGLLAETFVAQWLSQQGWEVLYRRWRCRWGEIDLIAAPSSTQLQGAASGLIFVEVKARRSGNWDRNGLLAITPQKQAKLWRSAEVFLATHPTFSDSACRFDVALVHYQRQVENGTQPEAFAPTLPTIRLGQALSVGGCRLTLRDYLPGAFGQ